MADRYWVGGTGNWSDTARWSTASGGGSGASVPTSADNVFFDNNSAAGTFTVTINTASAVCANFDASGITNAARKMTLTGTASVGLLQVNGSWTNPTGTYFAWSVWTGGTITFAATGTLTTNAVIFDVPIVINGAGATITLNGALTTSLTVVFTITNGSLDTSAASSYSFTGNSIVISANSNTRSLNLNASAVSLAGVGSYSDLSTGGYTLNAGTSTITCSNASPTFAGGGKTFYNVTFSSTAIGTVSITGSNTFNNLTFADKSAVTVSLIQITASTTQTINGTLTINAGNSANLTRRYRIYPSVTTSTVTINAAAVSLACIDFNGIVAGGVASPFTGTSFGNLLNNSNITFTGAKTVYWSLIAGGNFSDVAWATSSGGIPAAANFPLGQDTLIFDNAGLTAGNTVTLSSYYGIGTISSTRTAAWTFAISVYTATVVGNITFDANVTHTTGGGAYQWFGFGTNQTVRSNGTSFPMNIFVSTLSGSLRLDGNLTLTNTAALTLSSGGLDLTNNGAGNYTISTGVFLSTGTTVARNIIFGSGNITLTGNNTTIWSTANATNFTYTGTPTVNCTYSGSTGTRTIAHGNVAARSESNSVSFNVSSGADILAVTTGTGILNLNLTGFTGTYSASSVLYIYQNLTLSSGMTFTGGTGTINFISASAAQKLTTNGKIVDCPVQIGGSGSAPSFQFQDNCTIGSTRTLTFLGGTIDLNSKSISIGNVAATGTSSRAISFNSGTINLVGSGSTAWVASGSGLTTSGTGTISMTSASAKTFAGGGFTYTATLNQGGAGALTISGNNTFYDITATTLPSTITFTAGTTQTVTQFTASGTAGNLLTLNSATPGSNFTLSDSGGTNSVSYCSITDSIATGGAIWQSFTSNGNVDGGNNYGWLFTAVPVTYIDATEIKLRSLAQRGRF